jgi:hypothetical protein
VASYWRDCSFGLLDPSFDLAVPLSSRAAPGAPAGWHEWNYVSTRAGGSRWTDLSAGITQAYLDGMPEDTYDNFVIFVDPPPCDAGAAGLADALFDEAASLDFFIHEVGHVLGFDHPFGLYGEKEDPYCVMAYQGVKTFTVTPPQPLADLPAGSGVWQASRRPATATLYRYLPAFRASGSVQAVNPWPLVTTPVVIGGASEHDLVAASDATLNVDPLLVAAVVEPPAPPSPPGAPLGPPGELLLEYRRPKPDDWDRAVGEPVLVVHSLRLARNRDLTADAVFFEDALVAR